MSMGFRPILKHGIRRGLPSQAGFSRRRFLKSGIGLAASAAAGSTLASLAGCKSTARRGGAASAGDDRPMRVVVVGAGLAGLACADALLRGGADVRVYEATGRPGGRVMTDRRFLPGRTIEFGAEFIGTNHPTWVEYAQRFGIQLALALDYDGEEPILLNGRVLRGEEADNLYKQIDAVVARLIELARPIDPVRPWRSPNAAALDRQSYAQFLGEMQLGGDARALLTTIAEADNGVAADRMSLLAYLAMIAGGQFTDYFEISETHRAIGGNDSLARALSNWLGERVWFNAPVVSIQRLPTHAVVHAARGNPIECEAVVLAVPPSVWHRIAFESPLQKRVPQMGRNVKLITKVTRPVWEEHGLTPELISDGLVQLTWVSAENQPGLPKSFTLFAGGRQAEALRRLDSRSRTRRAVEAIEPVYPQLSGAVSDSRFVDWPGFTYALASYSFPAPGEVMRFGPTLVDGWDDGRAPLRFAGEHTSYGFIGYMEGALQSGLRVADELLARAGQSPTTRPGQRQRQRERWGGPVAGAGML